MSLACHGRLARYLHRTSPFPVSRSATGQRLAAGGFVPVAWPRRPTPHWDSPSTFGQRRQRHRSFKSPSSETDLGDAKAKSKSSPTVLHEDIYTIPNLLTVTRLAAAPAIGCLLLYDARAWAVGLLAYAAATDVVDGWIARRWNCKTVVGTVLDPMADKALMTVLTACLTVTGDLPAWLTTIILGRDAGLGVAAIYYRWISLSPPKTFTRYWDFSLPSAEVRPTIISKYNTFLQLTLVGATTVAPLLETDLSATLDLLQHVVAITTLWSGLSYVISKDAVKIIK